jgi:proprotein convertase subtilisin/kexin type 5
MMGHFENKTQICPSCAADCSMCLSTTNCLSCAAGFFMDNAQCVTSCPVRYYPSTVTYACEACPYDCLTCNSSGLCLSCSAAELRVLHNVTLRCLPMTGYWDNNTRVVVPCPLVCYSCSSHNCHACIPGYFLQADHLCYANCLVRFYPSYLTLSCQACAYDCYSCNGGSICLTCNATTDFR